MKHSFGRRYYRILPLMLILLVSGCAQVAVMPAATETSLPSPTLEIPVSEETPGDVLLPDSSDECLPCVLPDIEPLPEGYTLEGDIGAQASQTEEGTGEYMVITAQEAKDRMAADTGVIVVDVRTQEEYEAGHIPGALLIPNETIIDQPPEQLADKSAVILVYCRSGNRSRQASLKLLDMGYSEVYDFGGIIDWPYDTVTGAQP